MTSYRLLDLCCGEGLAAWGYWLSGQFSEIVGVDLADMRSKYAFDFMQASITILDYGFLSQFDLIHASPPCQWYSVCTPAAIKQNHWRSIPPTRAMLDVANVPFVIENVSGAKRDLEPNLSIEGRHFGLPLKRTRFFHASFRVAAPPIRHQKEIMYPHGNFLKRDELIEAFGLEIIPIEARAKLTREGIKQGIPPAFTRYIASYWRPGIHAIATHQKPEARIPAQLMF